MAFFRGVDGSVALSGTPVGQVSQWSLQTQAEMLETTSMGDVAKDYVGGLVEWSGSCQVKLDYGLAQQQTLISQLITASPSGGTISISFRVSATKYFSGNALVKDVSFTTQLGQVIGATFNLQGSGVLSVTWS